MAPRINVVKIAVHEYSPYRPQSTIHEFSSLVSQLFLLASRIEYTTHIETTPIELQLDAVNNLECINCSCFDSSDEAVQLARQNAPTLQILIIKMRQVIDVPGLIRDTNGRHVAYTCLHTLELECQRRLDLSQRPVFVGTLFFPRLRHMDIKTDYPFGDDTLFRGNAGVLEYLSMELDIETVTMFKEYNVFTPTSHPKLRFVKVGNMQRLVPTYFATSVEYMQFVLGIAPGAPTRVIYDTLSNVSSRLCSLCLVIIPAFRSCGCNLQACVSGIP
ncbi:hypothetical protein GGI24_002178 [Coemansia furcata]|nr:hypothetical protein GGI24_002178 [Coemansia furcata]